MVNSTTQRKPVQRTLKVLSPIQADGRGQIRISAGKVVEVYAVQTFEAYAGDATGVSLTKSDGTVYHCCLSNRAAEVSCDCRGHLRHGHCKHIDGLNVLANLGRLPLPVEAECGEAAGY